MTSPLFRLMLAFGCVALAVPALATSATAPLVDHHLHIFSPASSRVLKGICAALGPGHCPDEVSKEPGTAKDVLQALDAAHIRQGVLLSGAYFFASPAAAAQKLDVPAETRAENTFIVDQARLSCGRLMPFISVSPLWDGAVAEIDYWGKHGGAVGVKLHLGNSGVDLSSREQVRKLAAVFGAADRNHLAIVIHLQTQASSFGPKDVHIFLRDVAPAARHVPVQIAHAGSGGGLDKNILAGLQEFATEIRARPKETRYLYFDLAMVPDLFSNTRKLSAPTGDTQALTRLMRQIGLKRFLPASDYTLGLDLSAYYANQKLSLALSEREWASFLKNKAPYVITPTKARAHHPWLYPRPCAPT
ncbi:amidohydrolase family protein [Sphingosinicellaceae bacterium]|nr:amidohydrolase family protein [Sphingosinicellaceae bacterium]